MTLTPNGRRMLEYVQRLLSLAEEAHQAMNLEQPSGRLYIGALEYGCHPPAPGLRCGGVLFRAVPEVDPGCAAYPDGRPDAGNSTGDTYLIVRSAYRGSAYEELLRYVEATGRLASGSDGATDSPVSLLLEGGA